MNIYGTIIRRVYGEYTITSFLGNFGTCANSYQAAFLPPPSRPGYEANLSFVRQYFDCHVTSLLESDWRALYDARRHGPYTHLTRPLLAFCVGGTGLRDYAVSRSCWNISRTPVQSL